MKLADANLPVTAVLVKKRHLSCYCTLPHSCRVYIVYELVYGEVYARIVVHLKRAEAVDRTKFLLAFHDDTMPFLWHYH